MPREPWKIAREMFLSETETESLLDFLSRRESRAIDPAERSAALADRVIVETLLWSGLRNSEFCRLKLRDTVVGQKRSVLVVEETPRQNRVVHVPVSLSGLIQRFCRDARPPSVPDGVSPRDPSQPLVFNERGKPYERTALYRRVVGILAEAGLVGRASVQLLRHTYGYLAYKRTNGNLLFVQRQLGHAHPMVTVVYAEFVEFPPEQLANQIAAMPTKLPRRKSLSKGKRS